MRHVYQPYPKMVYDISGKTAIINGPDEMPTGFMTRDEYLHASSKKAAADAAGGAVIRQNAADAPAQAPQAPAPGVGEGDDTAARKAELRAFLDEHKVEYDGRAGLVKLEELATQLREHLAAAEPAGNAGQ